MSYQANVIYRVDDRGQQVAHVELSNRPGIFCVLDEEDWAAWVDSGRSQSLYLQLNGRGSYAVAFSDKHSGRAGYAATAARAILTPPRHKVVFRNSKDYLDLRRCNLRLQDRYRARDNSYQEGRADGLL